MKTKEKFGLYLMLAAIFLVASTEYAKVKILSDILWIVGALLFM